MPHLSNLDFIHFELFEFEYNFFKQAFETWMVLLIPINLSSLHQLVMNWKYRLVFHNSIVKSIVRSLRRPRCHIHQPYHIYQCLKVRTHLFLLSNFIFILTHKLLRKEYIRYLYLPFFKQNVFKSQCKVKYVIIK